jgi:hypothetical protein
MMPWGQRRQQQQKAFIVDDAQTSAFDLEHTSTVAVSDPQISMVNPQLATTTLPFSRMPNVAPEKAPKTAAAAKRHSRRPPARRGAAKQSSKARKAQPSRSSERGSGDELPKADLDSFLARAQMADDGQHHQVCRNGRITLELKDGSGSEWFTNNARSSETSQVVEG